MVRIWFQDIDALDVYNFGLVNSLVNSDISVTFGASQIRNFVKGMGLKSCLKNQHVPQNERLRIKLMNPPKSESRASLITKSLDPLYQRYFASFDLLHLNFLPAPYVVPALKVDVPRILTFHDHMLADEQNLTKINELSQIFDKMSYVTTPNKFMARILKEKLDCNAIVIPHAINVNQFSASMPKEVARCNLGISPSAKVVFWNSRLSPEKQPEILIDAIPTIVKKLPPVVFLIHCKDAKGSQYGRQMLQYAKTKFERADVESNVRFIFKFLTHEELMSYYHSADVFVHTSRLEAFGLVLAESMACKVPIVATDTPWSREILGDYALFFKQGNSIDLAEKVIKLLEDENLCASLSERAYRRVSNFSWKEAAQAYINLYKLAIQER
ncbi:MAG: glycosyltransferase family 4 protein [Candidatus Bathyarchaeia archaeon]|jgi:glycosyltransferase involved in cell wall biosynthesis